MWISIFWPCRAGRKGQGGAPPWKAQKLQERTTWRRESASILGPFDFVVGAPSSPAWLKSGTIPDRVCLFRFGGAPAAAELAPEPKKLDLIITDLHARWDDFLPQRLWCCVFCAFSFLHPFPRREKCGTLACKAGQKVFLFAALCPGALPMRTHAVLGSAAGKARPEAPAGVLSSATRPLSPLQCALTKKSACNSFGICTYKLLDLKWLC